MAVLGICTHRLLCSNPVLGKAVVVGDGVGDSLGVGDAIADGDSLEVGADGVDGIGSHPTVPVSSSVIKISGLRVIFF